MREQRLHAPMPVRSQPEDTQGSNQSGGVCRSTQTLSLNQTSQHPHCQQRRRNTHPNLQPLISIKPSELGKTQQVGQDLTMSVVPPQVQSVAKAGSGGCLRIAMDRQRAPWATTTIASTPTTQ